MNTDYKFWYIRRENGSQISECAVRFFEGQVITENEKDNHGNLVPVTRYRRGKRLKKADLPHIDGKKIKIETNGNEAVIFTSEDFGSISSDDELRDFVNRLLKKDAIRIPIPEQSI